MSTSKIIVNVTIKDKIASVNDSIAIVCRNKSYVARFTFDDEWSEYALKTARFVYKGGEQEVIFKGNECPIPELFNTNYVEIGVYAGDLATTTAAYVRCKKSILCVGGKRVEPTPDIYNQLLELLHMYAPSETRGYYYSCVDTTNNKIYLSHEQVKPIIGEGSVDSSFPTPAYKAGGRLGVVNNFEYAYGTSHFLNNITRHPNATIVSVEHNVITYEGDIGFSGIYELSSLGTNDYSVYCLDEPGVGDVILMGGGITLGYGNTIIGNYGFSTGMGNEVLGSYGVAIGRKLVAGYAAFATNLGNKALAHRSFASGSETQAEEFAAHTEGEGTIARSVIAQHVEGRYNIPDDEGRYQHIVGGGTKVFRNNEWEIIRRNIHTLSTDGVAWYAKGVRVGGTSEDDAEELPTETRVIELAEEAVDEALIAANIRAEGQTPGTTCPIAGANLGESRSNKLFAFPANRIKLHALVDDVWTEVNDPNLHKLFTNGMQAYTDSKGVTKWKPFDNEANYLGTGTAVPTAWRITLTNPVRSQGGDRYVHFNAACIRVQGTPANSGIDLRVAGRQQKGTEVTYISSFALAGSPSYNTSYFDNGVSAAFGGWTPSTTSTNLDTLYIYFSRDTSKSINKNFAVDEIHFFGRQTYVSDLNMVNHDHAYKVGANGKDVAFQGKVQVQPATEDNETVTLGQMKKAFEEQVGDLSAALSEIRAYAQQLRGGV